MTPGKRLLAIFALAVAPPPIVAAVPECAPEAQPCEPSPAARDANRLADAVAVAIRTDEALSQPLRGSVTLPDSGANIATVSALPHADRAVIRWKSSDPGVVSDTDRRVRDDVVRKGSVVRGTRDRAVRLTATISVPGTRPRVVTRQVTVPARAVAAPTEAYLFVYFTGNSVDGEKLRFATSDGNNALRWKRLNDAQPVLESRLGTRGLRDPFIMRSAEGDRFFLLATDLSTGRTGWGGATDKGSHYLEIWESTDLVHWGRQRHVRVNLPNAGMTWAPEASYDPTIDAYVVYWTSTLFADAARTRPDGNGPQILTSITRDFRTFETPRPWFKSADLPELVRDKGMIDATVLKDGDHYYRFTKVTQANGCPSADIIAQRSRSLRSTSAWQVVDRCIGRNAGTPEVEGPSAFAANPGDTSGYRFFLWVDDYGGVGYIPLATRSLTGDIDWTYPKGFDLPASPRHGSVVAITAQERDALAARWNRALLVTSVAPVSVSVPPGAGSVPLPPTVTATFADGHREQVGVAWAPVAHARIARAGDRVAVKGRLANSAATMAEAVVTVTAR